MKRNFVLPKFFHQNEIGEIIDDLKFERTSFHHGEVNMKMSAMAAA
jgi:hypothetical protein